MDSHCDGVGCPNFQSCRVDIQVRRQQASCSGSCIESRSVTWEGEDKRDQAWPFLTPLGRGECSVMWQHKFRLVKELDPEG